MANQALQLALVGVGAFAMAVLAVELARRPILLVQSMLAVYAWSLVAVVPTARIVGIGVSPVDLVNAVALGAALIRMRRGPRSWQWALLGAVALILISALRGYALLGDAALLGFRAELYFVVPAVFVATLPRVLLPRVIRAVSMLGLAMALFAAFRWAAPILGLPMPLVSDDIRFAIQRVIPATAALWVSFALIASFVHGLQHTPAAIPLRNWSVTAFSLAVVVLGQHRSVWVATAVMLASSILVTRRRWLTKAMLAVVVVIGGVLIVGVGLDEAGVLGESLSVAASDTRTWQWRLDRWVDVWSTHAMRGPIAIIAGSGYGYGWATGTVGVWEVSPHNGFIQVAVRIGLVGALLVYLPYVVILRRLSRGIDPTARILWLWTIGSLLFYIPYSGNMVTGAILGAALAASMARADPRERAEMAGTLYAEEEYGPAPAAVGARF